MQMILCIQSSLEKILIDFVFSKFRMQIFLTYWQGRKTNSYTYYVFYLFVHRTPNLLLWPYWQPPVVRSALLPPRFLSVPLQPSRSLADSSPSSLLPLLLLPPRTWASFQPKAMWFSCRLALALPALATPLCSLSRAQLGQIPPQPTYSIRWSRKSREPRPSR